MQQIPEALRGMTVYKQWCVWKLVQKPGKPKPDKIPFSGVTGLSVNHTDPNQLTDYETACQTAEHHGMNGVAFVFTENDPYFFLDIDACLIDGQWSELAYKMCQTFSGCAVEVSQSGKGLHLFGRCDQSIEHKKKNTEHGLELYTELRFVALSGGDVQGNIDHADYTQQVQWLVDNFFKPDEYTYEGVLDEGPCAEWSGPTDDDELITKARSSLSPRAALGLVAKFGDLFDGNATILSRIYPDEHGGNRSYDGSSADAALAQHLAFWTGRDAARIERIMWRSGLVRDKWTQHKSYLAITINNACQRCQEVYCDPKQPLAPLSEEFGKDTIEHQYELKGNFQFLSPTQQIEHFKGCVYVAHSNKIMVPGGNMFDRQTFNAMYGGYVFALDSVNDKTQTDAWKVFTESQAVKFPKVVDDAFRPDLEPGEIFMEDGELKVNSYFPAPVKMVEGDPTPFLNHLHKLLPNGEDGQIMLSYMAAIVQHPGIKFQWCPLVIGAPGNGKSLLTTVVEYSVGFKYTHKVDDVDAVSNGFNAWLGNKIFVGFEDVYSETNRRGVYERLKPIITNKRQSIVPKGVDAKMAWVVANVIMNSNHDDALPKLKDDRRLCFLYTAQSTYVEMQRDGIVGDYMPNLYDWFNNGGNAIVAQYLKSFKIPDCYNPATHCHRAPNTTTTARAMKQSLGGIEQEVIDAIAQERPGFASNWISSVALNELIKETHKRLNKNKYEETMRELGYIKHPALQDGRAVSHTSCDRTKPILFVLDGSPESNLSDPVEVTKAYDKAQREAGLNAARATL